MSRLGGKDTYDFIKRCFQETFCDILAKEYTYDGTKTKSAFKNSKLCLLFMGKFFLCLTKLRNEGPKCAVLKIYRTLI